MGLDWRENGKVWEREDGAYIAPISNSPRFYAVDGKGSIVTRQGAMIRFTFIDDAMEEVERRERVERYYFNAAMRDSLAMLIKNPPSYLINNSYT